MTPCCVAEARADDFCARLLGRRGQAWRSAHEFFLWQRFKSSFFCNVIRDGYFFLGSRKKRTGGGLRRFPPRVGGL